MDFEIWKFSLHLHWGPKTAARTEIWTQRIYPLQIFTEGRLHFSLCLLTPLEVYKAAWHLNNVSCWNDFTAVLVSHVGAVWPWDFRLNSLRNIKSATKTNFQSHSVLIAVVKCSSSHLKVFNLNPELKHSNRILALPLNCCVGTSQDIQLLFRQKFTEPIMVTSMRANEFFSGTSGWMD